MTIHSITFAQPVWLLVGLVAAATLLVLGVRLDRRRSAALAAFGSRRLGAASSLSRPRRVCKRALLVVGVLAACSALARPQRGYRWEEVQRRGVDLLFAIDTSKSMRAPDLKPDRLTRAKLAVADLVTKFQGDRVGLVAFAGDAFLQCPLTLDRDMFSQTLEAVDTSIIARGGTDVGRAIEVARAALHNEPANQKILVFLTDGEDLEAHAVDDARAAAGDGVRIYTVGVGTGAGELIPLGTGADGRFVRDEAGAFVRSRLDEKTLQTMASLTGGDYRRLGADGGGLEALYRDVLAKLPRESLGTRMRRVPLEQFQWPLALALACLALEPLIRERRRVRVAGEPPPHGRRFAVFARRATVAAMALVALSAARPALAAPADAERAYRTGHFDEASKAYAHVAAASPSDSRLQYNAGAAAYKAGDLTSAKAAFDRALRSERLDLQRNAYYDLGNTLFRDGQKTVAQAPDKTIDAWKRSVAAYESALALDKKDADATFNRELVKRKLAELERQQKQKQEQNQQSQQSKQSQSQSQKSGQGGQSKSAQNQSGQGQSQKSGQGGQSKSARNQGGQGPSQKSGQGGQSKSAQNQGGQGQSQKSAQGDQAKGAQNQSAQSQGSEGQSQQSGQRNEAKRAQDQAQPGQAQGGQPVSAAGAPNGRQAAQEGDEPAAPGRLSRNDAKGLLDALRGDERLLPAARAGDERGNAQEVVNRKDW